MFEDPFIGKIKKRSDIVFTNTLNNPLNRNFTLKDDDLKLPPQKPEIEEEWQGYHFIFKVVRLDLYNQDDKPGEPNMTNLYA